MTYQERRERDERLSARADELLEAQMTALGRSRSSATYDEVAASLEIANAEELEREEQAKLEADDRLRLQSSRESQNAIFAHAQVRLAEQGRRIEDVTDQAELAAIFAASQAELYPEEAA